MALKLSSSSLQQGARATRTRSSRPCRMVVIASATQPQHQALSRRDAVGGAAAVVLANLLTSAPARAGLFGPDDAEVQATYAKETADILGKVRGVIGLDRDDPTKEEAVKELRKDINSWVAKYRREQRVAGRPSFGAMYAALNTLAGHYNSFGLTAPLPKKRMDNLNKELEDAALYLSRDR